MKKFLFATVLALVSFGAFAQNEKPLTFSIGVDGALPMGDFGKAASFGIGGSFQGNYNLDESLALVLNAGYMNYSYKSSVGGGNAGVVPVLAGIEYNFTPQVFATGLLGMSFSTTSGGGSSFTYAPGIGFRFAEKFSALLKYQAWSKSSVTNSQVGVRLAYSF